jgi:hypothetical protein
MIDETDNNLSGRVAPAMAEPARREGVRARTIRPFSARQVEAIIRIAKAANFALVRLVEGPYGRQIIFSNKLDDCNNEARDASEVVHERIAQMRGRK